MRKGFERAPLGSALIHLLGLPSQVHPEAIVKLQSGKLAYYRLSDWDDGAESSFTVWQGKYSDVYAWGLSSFEQALAEFTSIVTHDSADGAVIERSTGWSLVMDTVMVDCGKWTLEVSRRSDLMVPIWDGAKGKHVQLYRPEEPVEDTHDPYVYIVSPTATAYVRRRLGEEPLASSEVSAIAEGVYLEWK